MTILEKIVEDRRKDIRSTGHHQGIPLPEKRSVCPVPFGKVAFGKGAFIICEIKRKSPSKGMISKSLDAVEQAMLYFSKGVRSVSVLTEENHFGGSLRDLVRIKKSLPRLSVLRKDFLLDEEDVRVSFRAGADAVLLIASILEKEKLEKMYHLARSLGMAALVEVHSRSDVTKVADFEPAFIGVNSRDLETFRVDPCHPLMIRSSISWNTRAVFESGISSLEDAVFALTSGFEGILVGESVVKRQELIEELMQAGSDAGRYTAKRSRQFWRTLYSRKREGKPLIKICGLTREEDVRAADDCGADILGFILAESPRRTNPDFIRSLGVTRALKAGVVVLKKGGPLPREVRNLLEEGILDTVQFHGEEAPDECFSLAFPYYKALRVAGPDDVKRMSEYRCPRLLIDAYVPGKAGGTGSRIDESLVALAGEQGPFWLAGGLHPGNIRETIQRYDPELVDASSGLETKPGIKDKSKLKTFFREIDNGKG